MASENDQGYWETTTGPLRAPNLAQWSCIDKLAHRRKCPGRSGPTLPLGKGPHDASVTDCFIDTDWQRTPANRRRE
jgi:hypothetical protein